MTRAALLLLVAAGCVRHVPHATHLVTGTLAREVLPPKDDLTGLGDPVAVRAGGVPFTIRRGAHVVAHGVTAADGRVTARASGDTITFTAAIGDVAVAHGAHIWEWTRPIPPSGDLGDCTIRVREGSGALQALRAIVTSRAYAASIFPRLGPRYERMPSIALMWAPGRRYGSTFYEDPYGGGVQVGDDFFDSVIFVDGTDATNAIWTESILDHELGHMVMDLYGVIPEYDMADEQMLHLPEPPAIAWAEGWATFWAQAVRSWRDGVDRPVAIFEDDGDWYAIDLRTCTLHWPAHPEAHVALPDPCGPRDQPLAEAFVSSTLWRLRARHGDRAVIAAIAGKQTIRDLADYLDRSGDAPEELRCHAK